MPAVLMVLAWVVAAWAGPRAEAVAEEIVVYGDDFARWDGTRWLVQTEMVIPMGLVLARDTNEGFLTFALQIRGVIACDKEHRLGKRRYEVGCEIEDVGILATSMRRWRRLRDRQRVQDVLDEIDAKLTGLRIQMQTDFRGGVTNIDLEGLNTRTQRERTVQESLRQVVSRMMSGFHLRIPNHAADTGEWVEYTSNLMQIPSLTASRGSVMLKHVVSRRGDTQIVQTVGKGSSAINLPIAFVDQPSNHVDVAAAMDAQSGGGGVGTPVEAISGPDEIAGPAWTQESDAEATWEMRAVGVALFDRSTGIMTERVWLVNGLPTASAGQGTQLPPFRNAGRLTMLGSADRPDVGPTRQVAPPGRVIDGLPGWISIETFPE